MSLVDPDILTKLVKVIVADIMLAGDNALVIALATRGLPPKQQFWGRMFGAGGAVVLRIIFIVIIGYLLQVPYLQLVGGLLLLWIAIKLVRPQAEAVHEAAHPEEGGEHVRGARTLRDAITVIIVADLTMSFDNVVAIANIAKDTTTGQMNIPLVVFGLLFSIPLVVWGSTLISRLMERFRWIVWIGGGVLAYVAADIIFHDHKVLAWMGVAEGGAAGAPEAVKWFIRMTPWVLAVLLFIYGMWSARVAAADQGERNPA